MTVLCCQWIADSRLPSNTSQTRQCTRKAVWFTAERNDRGVCTQHKHRQDVRKIPR